VELTRERVAIKRKPFSERTDAEHRCMMALWSDCRVQKESIRHAALAYAFVRGRRYWIVERECDDQNKPSATAIAFWADADVDSVKAWLGAPVSSEEAAAFAAAVEAARVRAQSAHEARRKAKAA